MKSLTTNFKETAKNLFNSDLYIILLSLITLIGWTTGLWVAAILIMLTLTVIGTLVSPSLKHLLAFLVLFSPTMSTQTVTTVDVVLIVIFAVFEVLALVFNFIKYKRDFSVLHPKNVKGFTAAHIALAIPFLLAGLGSGTENGFASLIAAGIVIAITALYLIVYVGATKTGKNYMEYILKCVFALSLVASAEFIIYVLRFGNLQDIINVLQQKSLWIGWAGPNTLAPVISMGLPCTFYLTFKRNRLSVVSIPLLVIVGFMEFSLVVLSGCRGAMLFTIIIIPSLLIYSMWQSECKAVYFWSVTGVFVVFILTLITFSDEINPVIVNILSKGMSSSGRTETLYPEAVAVFKNNPLFGVGWGYKLSTNLSGFYEPYLFHSTFFQFLANMGIVGVVFLVIFFLWRYFLLLPMYKNPAAVCIIVSILLFDMYAMIDTSVFNPAMFLMLSMMSLTMEVDMPEGRCAAFLGKDPVKILKKLRNKTSCIDE